MGKKIVIDLEKWGTPRQLARELGFDKGKTDRQCTQRISMWMKRGKVNWKRIEELDLVLVERASIPTTV